MNMSSSGDTTIEIGIRVNTEQLSKANDLVKELANNLNSLRGATAQPFANSVSNTREFASAVTQVKSALSDVLPDADRTYQAMLKIANMSEQDRKSLVGTSSALAKIPGILGINTDAFVSLWGEMKKLSSGNLDDFAKDIAANFSDKNGITKTGNAVIALNAVMHQATGRSKEFGEQLSKIKPELEEINNAQISDLFNKGGINVNTRGISRLTSTLREGVVRELEYQSKQAERIGKEQTRMEEREAKERTRVLIMEEKNKLQQTKRLAQEAIAYQKGLNSEVNKKNKRIETNNESEGLQRLDILKTEEASKKLAQSLGGSDLVQFSSALGRINTEENRVATTSMLMANAHNLSKGELLALEKVTGLSTATIEKFGRTTKKLNNDMQVMKAYSNASKAAIGPLGTAFREVTMQLYWASLGFMFYTMTLTRASQAELTKITNANNLAKTYYNLNKMQKDLTKTVLEYGYGSEEAREASAQLMMAQKDLEIQQKSLGVSAKMQVMQEMQSYLSAIPLIVNSMYLMVQAQASVRGAMTAATTATRFNTSAKRSNGIQTQLLSTQTAANDAVTKKSASSNILHSISTKMAGTGLIGLVPKIRAATSALSSLASASTIVTMGIGAIASIGIMLAMNTIAEAEATKQMEEMSKEAEAMSRVYEEAGGSLEEFAKGSIDMTIVTLRDARSEVVRLTEELNQLKSTKENLGSIQLDSNINGNNKASLTINFNNPVVREETDIDDIIDKTNESLYNDYNSSGGRPD